MHRRALLLAILLAAVPGVAAAQARDCVYEGDRTSQVQEAGALIVLFLDPFVATCADGTELRANSGRLNRSIRELHLVGNVFFQDSTRTLTSSEAIYDSGTERLFASGDVVFVNRVEGSTLRGPELEYFRENAARPRAQVFATGRPTLTFPSRDSAAADSEPLQLVGDRVEIVGEDDLSAFGSVIITRTDLEATGGEANYNSSTESLELRDDAIIRSNDQELAGEIINAELTDGSLEYIHARTAAVLRGENLEVTAPDLQLFFTSDTLQRVTARIPPEVENERAVAVSRTFRLEADSLDASFIDQLLREVHAIGTARGETIDSTVTADLATGDSVETVSIAASDPTLEGPPEADSSPVDSVDAEEETPDVVIAADSAVVPDSITPSPPLASRAIIENDWIRGDTILAFFEPVPPAGDDDSGAASDPAPADAADPASGATSPDDALAVCAAEPCEPAEEDAAGKQTVELRRLTAIGNALSLYRLAGDGDPPGEKRNVNLLAAEQIELDMVDGELEVATATGLQQGIYLEANTPSLAPPTPAPLPPEPVIEAPADDTAMIGGL